jgi:predicted nucleotidyltransferase
MDTSMIQTASLEEIRQRFGTATARRQFLFGRLQALINHLLATGSLKHVYLFGSFVSGKASPNDVDLFAVMEAGFTTAHLSGTALEAFQHDRCKIRYHADVFWVTSAIGEERISDLLDVFSRNREKQQQPIIEVKV